ncbi:MAG: sensor histidine kinase [Sandaracinus sp.]|nr:sensor histidine kinase [Sandaracinus sp.]
MSGSLPSTLQALAAPRRTLPLALAGMAFVATEALATRDLRLTGLLMLVVLLFALLVPAVARWVRRRPQPARQLVLGLVAAALTALACGGPLLLWDREPYVAHPPAAPAIFVLVLLAGWILARDIDLDADLVRVSDRGAALAREVEDARLLALRQHLDPHFLFNTLGAIAEWCREDPLVAERALLELAQMLRLLFDGIREPSWPLARELEVLAALHRLHALRDDERHRLITDLAPNRALPVPPLVLLPLFENALTHGDARAPTYMSLEATEGAMVFRLWNSGAYAGPREGGTGIATTRRRLELAYGDGAALAVEARDHAGIPGTLAQVPLPPEPRP